MPTIDRSGCSAEIHGTRWAYSKRCRCADAKRVKARYAKFHAAGALPPARINAIGAKRRIRALQAIGYSLADLAQRLGYTSEASFSRMFQLPGISRERHRRIVVLYDQLSMTPGPSRRSVKAAQRKGWPPPLAWEGVDIDDSDAEAITAEDTGGRDDVDHVAVLLAVRGELDNPAHLSLADRRAVVAELTRLGASTARIAARLRCGHRTVDQLRGLSTAAEAFNH
ncbi:hypothetical protein MOQ72_41410 [Saccharopolyspora sp. K220]|uniref:hypothetical protein n=1 Tax=Saccharopolyspora soli TaxID=2926618 RepID=UPI001F56F1EF|nr:hypothetical protein [Saccharopolyspora soli]MCI2423879.1 hypothetical protein [Saccharopolyspora soli]